MKKFVNYVVAFFLLIGFTLTCNFLLFFTYIEMEPHEVRFAAVVTFGNVLFLAVIFGVADHVRRYFTVKRPVKKIRKPWAFRISRAVSTSAAGTTMLMPTPML